MYIVPCTNSKPYQTTHEKGKILYSTNKPLPSEVTAIHFSCTVPLFTALWSFPLLSSLHHFSSLPLHKSKTVTYFPTAISPYVAAPLSTLPPLTSCLSSLQKISLFIKKKEEKKKKWNLKKERVSRVTKGWKVTDGQMSEQRCMDGAEGQEKEWKRWRKVYGE